MTSSSNGHSPPPPESTFTHLLNNLGMNHNNFDKTQQQMPPGPAVGTVNMNGYALSAYFLVNFGEGNTIIEPIIMVQPMQI